MAPAAANLLLRIDHREWSPPENYTALSAELTTIHIPNEVSVDRCVQTSDQHVIFYPDLAALDPFLNSDR